MINIVYACVLAVPVTLLGNSAAEFVYYNGWAFWAR